jgi:UrcA family protein
MKSLTKCFAGMAGLALAALPIAALSTAAHAESTSSGYAQESVRVGDLNLSAPTGKAMFDQRVDHTARHFCSDERNLSLKAACQRGVRAEANEKAAANVQLASRN